MEPDARSSMAAMDAASQASQATSAMNPFISFLGRTDFSPALQMMSQQQAAPSGGGMRRGSFQPSANQLAALMEMRKRKPISLL